MVKNSEEEDDSGVFSEIEGDLGMVMESDGDVPVDDEFQPGMKSDEEEPEIESDIDGAVGEPVEGSLEEVPVSEDGSPAMEELLIEDETFIEDEPLPENEVPLSDEENIIEDADPAPAEQAFPDENISEE